MIELQELQVEMDYLKQRAVDGNLTIEIEYDAYNQEFRFLSTDSDAFMMKLVKWMKQELELKG